MAFQSAQATRASIGLLNASGYVRTLGHTYTAEMLDVTTLNDKAKVFIRGMDSSSGTFDMVLDTNPAANSQFATLNTWKSAQPTIVDVAPEGYATGNPVIMVNALETQVTTEAAVAGTANAKVSFMAASDTDYGISVEDYTTITITTTGTARDSGIVGGTANGGVAHLHVTSFTGSTNDIVTIEHSLDGSTSWTTLVTFSTVTGLTSERIVVAAGTTVRKFLRVIDTITGTPTLSRQVSFARR